MTIERDCEHCGKEVLTASTGRRKRFCSDACRKALKRGVSGQNHPSALAVDTTSCFRVERNSMVDLTNNGTSLRVHAGAPICPLTTRDDLIAAIGYG